MVVLVVCTDSSTGESPHYTPLQNGQFGPDKHFLILQNSLYCIMFRFMILSAVSAHAALMLGEQTTIPSSCDAAALFQIMSDCMGSNAQEQQEFISRCGESQHAGLGNSACQDSQCLDPVRCMLSKTLPPGYETVPELIKTSLARACPSVNLGSITSTPTSGSIPSLRGPPSSALTATTPPSFPDTPVPDASAASQERHKCSPK